METELTIVIPANEATVPLARLLVTRLLSSLCRQDYAAMRESRIVVVETGNGRGAAEAAAGFSDRLTVELARVEDGSRAAMRNTGARLATTPYVLFLEPDAELPERTVLDRSLVERAMVAMRQGRLELATTSIACRHGGFLDDLLYAGNNLLQRASKRLRPYASGVFLLFDREAFWRLGGFNEQAVFGEDYLLSKQVERARFQVIESRVLLSNQRLRRVGHGRMLRMFLHVLLHGRDERHFLRAPLAAGHGTNAVGTDGPFADSLLESLESDDGVAGGAGGWGRAA